MYKSLCQTILPRVGNLRHQHAPTKSLLSVTKHLNNRGHASWRKERERERELELEGGERYRHRDCWLDSHQRYRSALTRCHPWERDEDDDVDRRNVVRLAVTEIVKRKKPFTDVLGFLSNRTSRFKALQSPSIIRLGLNQTLKRFKILCNLLWPPY